MPIESETLSEQPPLTDARDFGGRNADQPSFAALLGTLYGVAVAVNFIWEVPQMAFYEWWGASWSVGLLICLQAALGDGLLVLTLYGLGYAFFRQRNWILQPSVAGYSLLVLAGMVIAVAIEMHALAWGRWAYNALMPVIPGLGVGLVPVVQMMILPTLIAFLTRWWLLGGPATAR
ncbi:hypothetical protein MYX64_09555 [Nitrospinae bacterium AH_259_B05_G02_I21]|nr:hypothetical protein [Nitrospinae bacterium AH_259_B05_G02_I21]MDA2932079.1 hypothetical protein [Nitrospinae bacterium AH-259-F20]